MTHTADHVEGNLEAAKQDVKSAGAAIVEEAKDKVHGAVDAVSDKIVEAVDKVHEAAHKNDFKK